MPGDRSTGCTTGCYIGEIEQQATKVSAADARRVDFAGLELTAEAFASAGSEVRARRNRRRW